jgi:hypothetical protein
MYCNTASTNPDGRQPSRKKKVQTTAEVIAHLPKIYEVVARYLVERHEIEIVDELPESSSEVPT